MSFRDKLAAKKAGQGAKAGRRQAKRRDAKPSLAEKFAARKSRRQVEKKGVEKLDDAKAARLAQREARKAKLAARKAAKSERRAKVTIKSGGDKPSLAEKLKARRSGQAVPEKKMKDRGDAEPTLAAKLAVRKAVRSSDADAKAAAAGPAPTSLAATARGAKGGQKRERRAAREKD